MRFLLLDERFPRAVATALAEVELGVSRLPRALDVLPVCADARRIVDEIDVDALDAVRLHRTVDDLQVAIGAVHDRIAAVYFLPS
jgi:uncharacterized alpha-E superfamily protein